MGTHAQECPEKPHEAPVCATAPGCLPREVIGAHRKEMLADRVIILLSLGAPRL